MAQAMIRASDIASFLGADLAGVDIAVERPMPFHAAGPGDMTYWQGVVPPERMPAGSLVLMTPMAAPKAAPKAAPAGCGVIAMAHPRAGFARAVAEYFAPRGPAGIAATARIAPTARIGADVSIGEYVVVRDNAVVGAGSRLCDHAIVAEGVVIGERCIVGEHAVVGCEGFGNELDGDEMVDFPHLGTVRIADDVRIGAGSTIARGTLSDTVIGRGTRISQGVNIAHNAQVGELCTIAGQAQVSGSVVIGDRCWLGPNCAIIQKVRIGARSQIGIGATVLGNLPEGAVCMDFDGLTRAEYRVLRAWLSHPGAKR
jgi:UDP-3-O-[3-hydroxymyristoyl] glucosamine N-acyltransferase